MQEGLFSTPLLLICSVLIDKQPAFGETMAVPQARTRLDLELCPVVLIYYDVDHYRYIAAIGTPELKRFSVVQCADSKVKHRNLKLKTVRARRKIFSDNRDDMKATLKFDIPTYIKRSKNST